MLLPRTRTWPRRRERKQEMLAIAGLLCTLWEIMGGVRGGGDVPRARVPHQHPVLAVWTGSSLSCHRPHHFIILQIQSSESFGL